MLLTYIRAMIRFSNCGGLSRMRQQQMTNNKWVWPGNATITHHRLTYGTVWEEANKNNSNMTSRRQYKQSNLLSLHQRDDAKLERTQSTAYTYKDQTQKNTSNWSNNEQWINNSRLLNHRLWTDSSRRYWEGWVGEGATVRSGWERKL